MAAAAAGPLLADQRWQRRVQQWVQHEGQWLAQQLTLLPGVVPMPSAANYVLLRGVKELESLRESLERDHYILVRTAISFAGLDDHWLRIGFSDRRGHKRLLAALAQQLGKTG